MSSPDQEPPNWNAFALALCLTYALFPQGFERIEKIHISPHVIHTVIDKWKGLCPPLYLQALEHMVSDSQF